MKKLLFISLITLFLLTGTGAPLDKNPRVKDYFLNLTGDVEINVHGLVCTACAIGIKKKLSKISNIIPTSIRFDIKKQNVYLALFDPSAKLDEKEVKIAVKKAGYEVMYIKFKVTTPIKI